MHGVKGINTEIQTYNKYSNSAVKND